MFLLEVSRCRDQQWTGGVSSNVVKVHRSPLWNTYGGDTSSLPSYGVSKVSVLVALTDMFRSHSMQHPSQKFVEQCPSCAISTIDAPPLWSSANHNKVQKHSIFKSLCDGRQLQCLRKSRQLQSRHRHPNGYRWQWVLVVMWWNLSCVSWCARCGVLTREHKKGRVFPGGVGTATQLAGFWGWRMQIEHFTIHSPI